MVVCAACGAEAPEQAKFCMECAAPLAPAAAPVSTRKVVTAVFCDVAGSTSLGESRDPEALRAVMTQYFAAMRAVLERHGGSVEKFIGDAVMAVFGVPVVHEDDAVRAVRAAVEMQQEILRLDDELERTRGLRLAVRIGVATGEVVVGDGAQGTVATGDAINVAARLEQAAGPGEVLVARSTYDLVREQVEAAPVADLTVRGKAEPLAAWLVTAVDAGPRKVTSDVPLVGRDRELELVRRAFADAVAARACHLVTVLGAPGMGKTRLVGEFLDGVDARVLRGRCLSYGDLSGLWPLTEIVRDAAGDEDGLRALLAGEPDGEAVAGPLAALLGTGGTPSSPEDTMFAVRRLIEVLGRGGPLVVVVDDIHWASAVLLDVIDHVVDWAVDAPVTIVCAARPELLDARPGWGGGKQYATTTSLRPLDTAAGGELVAALLADSPVPDDLRAEVIRAAGGVPLFAEQMVAMVADDPTVVTVPPTISALLAARVDRLSPVERDLLGAAAVMGHVFYRGGLVELSGSSAPEVATLARTLVRKDFLAPSVSDLPGEEALEFRHILLRDAAYASRSKATRAELHQRFARWLDGHGAERDDLERFAVSHLAEAVRLRDDLGPRDASTEVVAAEAARRLVAVARRVSDLDVAASGRMLDEATALMPAGPEKLRLLLSRSLLSLDGADSELNADTEAARAAAALADELDDERGRRLAWLRVAALELRFGIDPPGGLERSRRELATFQQVDDPEGIVCAAEAVAAFLQMGARWIELGEMSLVLRAAAERLGEYGVVRAADRAAAGSALRGAAPISEALQTLEQILSRARSPRVQVRVIEGFALLHARTGDDEALLAARRRSDEMHERFGIRSDPVVDASVRADIALVRREYPAAIEYLRGCITELERLGESGFSSNLLATLGMAHVWNGELGEAHRAISQARELTAETDVSAQLEWRLAQAWLDVAEGRAEAAVPLARRALELAELGETVDDHGRARMILGVALAGTGESNESTTVLREARAVFLAREDRVSARRVEDEAAAAGVRLD